MLHDVCCCATLVLVRFAAADWVVGSKAVW
jgi:hypothetical protein